MLIFADGRGRILKKSRRHLDFQNRVWPDCCGREKDEREHFPLFLPTFWVGVLAGFPGNVGFANTVRLALAALPLTGLVSCRRCINSSNDKRHRYGKYGYHEEYRPENTTECNRRIHDSETRHRPLAFSRDMDFQTTILMIENQAPFSSIFSFSSSTVVSR